MPPLIHGERPENWRVAINKLLDECRDNRFYGAVTLKLDAGDIQTVEVRQNLKLSDFKPVLTQIQG